jgi:hypothetical protein
MFQMRIEVSQLTIEGIDEPGLNVEILCPMKLLVDNRGSPDFQLLMWIVCWRPKNLPKAELL